MIGKILTNSALTVLLRGMKDPFVISRDHKLFTKLLNAVNAGSEKEVRHIIDMANQVQKLSDGKVSVVNGKVYYQNEVISDIIAERILDLVAMDMPFSSMARFLENLMLNPSYSSRQELYLFLENGNMPITEDGRFLAYKWVRDDYYDVHTGRFAKNVPGAVVKMDRGQVDDNRNITCSKGLHVCTHAYTKFGPRLMVVAINPKDVVSVPVDYDNAKMRVSQYEVLFEVDSNAYEKFTTPFFNIEKKEPEKAKATKPTKPTKPTKVAKQKRDRYGRFI